jgi:hypothetical protein
MIGPKLLVPLVVAAGAAAGPQAAPEPVVAVAYPGSPAGVPKEEDLAAIKTMGFTGVEWRPGSKTAFASLTHLAAPLGLTIVTRTDVSIRVDRPRSDLQAALWRAIAKGAKVVTLDPGQPTGSGLVTTRGDRLPWTYAASTFAGQITASARLFAVARPGPPVRIASPVARGLEVALLDGERAWVLIATNTAGTRATFVAHLPVEVAAALWVSLIDGGTMSMLRETTGPRWTAAIEPGAAMVFVIDKAPR